MMLLRMTKVLFLGLFCLLLLNPSLVLAQGASATVSGTVVDPDSDLVPGATITLSLPGGKPAAVVKSGSDGTYSTKVAPGTYSFTVVMQGFSPFIRQAVKLTAGQALTLNAKMALENEVQQVQVTASDNTVSVDADSNASATVLKGDDLEALSDDPDELSSELSALAGPAVGPNGGQIYIDGFTGGQLPPKSSIREIRINQNPFSAQYDRLGYGRVEVFTKPGTDKFHGNFQLNGYDNNFNTGNPLLGPDAVIPPYHTLFFFGNVTGPLNHWASFTLGGSRRTIQDNTVINPTALYSQIASPGTVCLPTDPSANCAITNSFTQALLVPQLRWDITPRIDLALGEKNTLTTRFQYTSNHIPNQGPGSGDLASVATTSDSSEVTLQMSDTQIVSQRIINETRFEYQRTPSTQTPFSTDPSLNVAGAFEGGGATTGLSSVLDQHIEVQNYTSIQLKKNFIRFGGRLRTTGETNTSTSGVNGTFSYASIDAYTKNTPNQYTVTQITTPTIQLRTTDLGLYAEDDWKLKPNLTISYGIRYETQNYIPDHKDFAPRVSFAYGLGKGTSPKTVLRGGFGIFYDRFMISNQASLIRQPTITQYVIQGDVLTSACTPANPVACPIGGQTTSYQLSKSMHAPYTMQTAIGVDQQIMGGATVSVNYLNARGVHQFNSENTTFVQNGGPTLTGPIQYQYQSEGAFRQNQLIVNVNYRPNRNFSLFGFYSLSFANANTGGISSFATHPGDLGADYGRAAYDVRNRLFVAGNLAFKYGIAASPFMVANSGTPFNLTTGTDNNLDSVINDRVAFAAAGTPGSKTIPGCGTFIAPTGTNYTEVGPNLCSGPANFTMNLRLTKTFGFGPRTGPPQGSGGGGGGRRAGMMQGGPRGGGGRGPGGPGGGGGTNTGRRYNLTIGAQGSNIFNVVDRGSSVGAFTSPKFGVANQLAGNIFTTNSAVRRVLLQASFTF
ncbi:TonB-dependent receptor [Granulicella sp. WH15]|uniref:TonB-dependent receptor n=1 Tax=Granulicella sp. WH15 TaxID=2602070 RepID=UPI00136784ED|nr:TonB-dependent receptor [Granulicella sp. WH15]QHN04276.1 TonB-dependent receptor [Granulicella sp. WH15]